MTTNNNGGACINDSLFGDTARGTDTLGSASASETAFKCSTNLHDNSCDGNLAMAHMYKAAFSSFFSFHTVKLIPIVGFYFDWEEETVNVLLV